MNAGATRRAVRLSLAYVLAVVAVYLVLLASTLAGPAAGTAGAAGDLVLVGIVAVVVALAGAVVSLGSAPRSVELGDDATVVVGRFGRRYRFPGRGQLKATVLQRVPVGLWTPVALESVELAGGSSRRTFLVDEGLLSTPEGPLPT